MRRYFINFSVVSVLCFFIFAANTQSSNTEMSSSAVGPEEGTRIYIPVGNPGVKKVLLAIEPTTGGDSVGQEFFQTMNNNMDYVDLFDLLPLTKIPEERGNFSAYKIVGAEFVIQSDMKIVGGKYEVIVRLLDVNKGTVVLARRYPFVGVSAQVGRELANFSGNDIIRALTGDPGIFRTKLLMSCGKKNRREIYMMDFDGQNVLQLTNDRNMVLSPSWSPDGNQILFTAYRATRRRGFVNPNLYMLDLRNKKQRVISSDSGLNSGGVFRPRSSEIAYVFSKKGRPEIFLYDLIKKVRMQVSVSQSKYFSVEPAWSPDGKMIAYSSHAYSGKDESHPHIYVVRGDGSGRKRLTFAGTYNSSPNWSPRGDKIVFSGQENHRNNFNIFTINPSNGADLQRLTDGSDSKENPVFSPDGRFIAYSGNVSGDYRIYVMTANGSRIRALTPPSLGSCKQPAWSPFF